MSSVQLPVRGVLTPSRMLLIVVGVFVTVTTLLTMLAAAEGGEASSTSVLAAEDSDDDATEDEDAGADAVQPLPVSTLSVAIARDPFDPVRPEPPPDAVADPDDPTDPADPTDPTDPVDPTDPTDPTDPGDPPAPPPPDDPDPANGRCQVDDVAVCNGTVVSVLDTGVDSAVFDVDGTTHTVAVGDTFAAQFRLLQVSGGCARVQHGDGDIFWICVDGLTK